MLPNRSLASEASFEFEFYTNLKLNLNRVCLQNVVPIMGPFSGPRSGRRRSGTHSVPPSCTVRFLGRETGPYSGPRAVRKFASAPFFFPLHRLFFSIPVQVRSCSRRLFVLSAVEAYSVLQCLWNGSGTCSYAVREESVVQRVGSNVSI